MNTAVVIVGGGFGGLEAAFTLKSLAGDAVTITLIDRDGFHSFTCSSARHSLTFSRWVPWARANS